MLSIAGIRFSRDRKIDLNQVEEISKHLFLDLKTDINTLALPLIHDQGLRKFNNRSIRKKRMQVTVIICKQMTQEQITTNQIMIFITKMSYKEE